MKSIVVLLFGLSVMCLYIALQMAKSVKRDPTAAGTWGLLVLFSLASGILLFFSLFNFYNLVTGQ